MLITQEAINAELAYRLQQVVTDRDRTAVRAFSATVDRERHAAKAKARARAKAKAKRRAAVRRHVRPA